MKAIVQETKTNKIQNQPNPQISLNIKGINALDFSKATAYDQYITVPYADPALLQDENIQLIVTRIAEQTDWLFPDYDRTKFNLVFEVNEDFEISEKLEVVSTSLQIIAQPPVYTEQEKENILKHETTDDEMYITWQEIFYHAEDYYKNEDKHFDDSYEEVEVELGKREVKEIEAVLYNALA